jgi:hypothetical protein
MSNEANTNFIKHPPNFGDGVNHITQKNGVKPNDKSFFVFKQKLAGIEAFSL